MIFASIPLQLMKHLPRVCLGPHSKVALDSVISLGNSGEGQLDEFAQIHSFN